MAEFGQPILLETQDTRMFEGSAIVKMTLLHLEGLERPMIEMELGATVTPYASATSVFATGGFPGISVPAGHGTTGVPFCFSGLKCLDLKLILDCLVLNK